MANSLISIGIPAYNEAKYIGEAVRSAQTQSYENIEIVVSDNGSTDATYEIIRQASAGDERVVIIRNSYNIGATHNFRIVRDAARGSFFMWLGAHDILAPSFVEDAIRKLSNPRCAMVFPRCNFVDEGNPATVLMSGDSDIDTSSVDCVVAPVLVAQNLVKCSAIHGLFRATLVKGLPFERIYGGDDLILFLTAAYGTLEPSDGVGLLRRHPRVGETAEEKSARYEQAGILRRGKGVDRAVTAAYHIKWIWKLRHFSAGQRSWLTHQFLSVYRRRYNVSLPRVFVAAAAMGPGFLRGNLPSRERAWR